MDSEKKDEMNICCENDSMTCGSNCIKFDAIVEIDKRGQILLPKDLRENSNIKAGDKFALIRTLSGGEVCCITLIKAEKFLESAKNMLSPIMKEIFE